MYIGGQALAKCFFDSASGSCSKVGEEFDAGPKCGAGLLRCTEPYRDKRKERHGLPHASLWEVQQRRRPRKMLYLVGLGLSDETDITVKGLDVVKRASRVYLEAYTSILLVDQSALASPRGVVGVGGELTLTHSRRPTMADLSRSPTVRWSNRTAVKS